MPSCPSLVAGLLVVNYCTSFLYLKLCNCISHHCYCYYYNYHICCVTDTSVHALKKQSQKPVSDKNIEIGSVSFSTKIIIISTDKSYQPVSVQYCSKNDIPSDRKHCALGFGLRLELKLGLGIELELG